jgi:hypothetical protein
VCQHMRDCKHAQSSLLLCPQGVDKGPVGSHLTCQYHVKRKPKKMVPAAPAGLKLRPGKLIRFVGVPANMASKMGAGAKKTDAAGRHDTRCDLRRGNHEAQERGPCCCTRMAAVQRSPPFVKTYLG